jgi:hypothetical protein
VVNFHTFWEHSCWKGLKICDLWKIPSRNVRLVEEPSPETQLSVTHGKFPSHRNLPVGGSHKKNNKRHNCLLSWGLFLYLKSTIVLKIIIWLYCMQKMLHFAVCFMKLCLVLNMLNEVLRILSVKPWGLNTVKWRTSSRIKGPNMLIYSWHQKR